MFQTTNQVKMFKMSRVSGFVREMGIVYAHINHGAEVLILSWNE